MEGKRQAEKYRGHKIDVSADELRAGVWSWGYLIDDTIDGRCRTGAELPDAEAALRRAMLAARARAHELGK